MMKLVTVCIIIIFVLTSCGVSEKDRQIIPEAKPKQLLVLLYDISKSVDSYALLDVTHIEKIYYQIGNNGGGRFYGLHIKTNSNKQEPVALNVTALDTLPLKGNAYQQINRKKKNKSVIARFEASKVSFVEFVSDKLILPKSQNFSDVQDALQLAKQILEQPQFSDWDKHLLIISDMEHDNPPRHGLDKMSPVRLESQVSVGVVRPSARINLVAVLGDMCNITTYITINDAIESLLNQ